MRFKGKVWKFGDDVNTDEIIPARYLNITDERELGAHCMEGIDKDFSKKISKGDIIVAGKNFGCGSSREHAQLAIKGAGISCVIAEDFARIFYRNAINIALPIIECKHTKDIEQGDYLEADLDSGTIINLTSQKRYKILPMPDFIQEIISSGGLLKWLRKTNSTK